MSSPKRHVFISLLFILKCFSKPLINAILNFILKRCSFPVKWNKLGKQANSRRNKPLEKLRGDIRNLDRQTTNPYSYKIKFHSTKGMNKRKKYVSIVNYKPNGLRYNWSLYRWLAAEIVSGESKDENEHLETAERNISNNVTMTRDIYQICLKLWLIKKRQ